MPGLLLIIGLLGTFLGLGLALNNASNILSQPDALSTSAASDSMQNLLNMLQGLGTKFKTSTWGIIGFILLKTWSEITRFEEKRLSWVIRKVKVELDLRKQVIKLEDESKNVRMVQAITDSAHQTIAAFTGSIASMLEVLSKQEDLRIERQNTRENKLNDFFSHSNTQLSVLVNAINNNFSTLTDLIVENNQKAQERSSELVNVINNGFGGNAKLLNAIRFELEISSKTISEFSTNTRTLVEEMSKASSQMAEGARGVGIASSGLVGAVESFESKFTEVLDQIGSDLGKAINEMSLQAAHTLESGSNKLHAATSEISSALGQLSEDVQGTMQQVQGSINRALEIQQKSSQQFILSSNILAEKTQSSIDMTHKLTTPIELGLKAISESNREQAGVYRKLDASMKELQEMTKTLSTFGKLIEPIESISDKLNRALLKLNGINDHLTSIKNLEGYHEPINSIKNSLQHLEKQSSLIRSELQRKLLHSSSSGIDSKV
ncbi:hypothetical protein [Alishewanella jeotgali]|uniref:Uncharacterized protein n=1 Tax=Alishewanella jeotgali KCTC 22429 TaxID=1129374 RepID=H3Z9U5_9ALTE|nr:hypothetical protein [Alishewanella jeotgali]EHR42619.1 hypothetical protein AJE_00480 [Alishewanella jeotgali KCTC 22429]